METNREQREDEALAKEKAEAAAAEAAGIGGQVAKDSEDPAEQPLIEVGEGEAEGFELAERDLTSPATATSIASPTASRPPPEESSDAEYGEADEAIPEDK